MARRLCHISPSHSSMQIRVPPVSLDEPVASALQLSGIATDDFHDCYGTDFQQYVKCTTQNRFTSGSSIIYLGNSWCRRTNSNENNMVGERRSPSRLTCGVTNLLFQVLALRSATLLQWRMQANDNCTWLTLSTIKEVKWISHSDFPFLLLGLWYPASALRVA